jgi:hypothetical protein
MTANEAAIRKAYQAAEDKDISGWVNCFTEDGRFTDESILECCKHSRPFSVEGAQHERAHLYQRL